MRTFAGEQYYEFGPFRLEISEKLKLFRDGAAAPLTAKGCRILSVSSSNRGRAVSKEEIINECWEERNVEESALVQNIYRIRKVLRSGGDENIRLATVKKYGYRFQGDAELRVVESGDSVENFTFSTVAASKARNGSVEDRDPDDSITSESYTPMPPPEKRVSPSIFSKTMLLRSILAVALLSRLLG